MRPTTDKNHETIIVKTEDILRATAEYNGDESILSVAANAVLHAFQRTHYDDGFIEDSHYNDFTIGVLEDYEVGNYAVLFWEFSVPDDLEYRIAWYLYPRDRKVERELPPDYPVDIEFTGSERRC